MSTHTLIVVNSTPVLQDLEKPANQNLKVWERCREHYRSAADCECTAYPDMVADSPSARVSGRPEGGLWSSPLFAAITALWSLLTGGYSG